MTLPNDWSMPLYWSVNKWQRFIDSMHSLYCRLCFTLIKQKIFYVILLWQHSCTTNLKKLFCITEHVLFLIFKQPNSNSKVSIKISCLCCSTLSILNWSNLSEILSRLLSLVRSISIIFLTDHRLQSKFVRRIFAICLTTASCTMKVDGRIWK